MNFLIVAYSSVSDWPIFTSLNQKWNLVSNDMHIDINQYWKCSKNRTWFITFESDVKNFLKVTFRILLRIKCKKSFFKISILRVDNAAPSFVFGISRKSYDTQNWKKFENFDFFDFSGIKSEISQSCALKLHFSAWSRNRRKTKSFSLLSRIDQNWSSWN